MCLGILGSGGLSRFWILANSADFAPGGLSWFCIWEFWVLGQNFWRIKQVLYLANFGFCIWRIWVTGGLSRFCLWQIRQVLDLCGLSRFSIGRTKRVNPLTETELRLQNSVFGGFWGKVQRPHPTWVNEKRPQRKSVKPFPTFPIRFPFSGGAIVSGYYAIVRDREGVE